MTTKLTGREALAYMATGRWFMIQGDLDAHRMLHNYELVFWCGTPDHEISSAFDVIDALTDGITPCPDPTVKVDKYEEAKKVFLSLEKFRDPKHAELCTSIIDFWEEWFQRKEVKS